MSVTVGAGVIGLTGQGSEVVLPLLATQILWINLVTDSGPARAMGVDPPASDLMARKPRRHDERVIDARMWSGVLQIGAVMALATLITISTSPSAPCHWYGTSGCCASPWAAQCFGTASCAKDWAACGRFGSGRRRAATGHRRSD